MRHLFFQESVTETCKLGKMASAEAEILGKTGSGLTLEN